MKVSLVIYDLDCDPDHVSKKLELRPTSIERLGDKLKNGQERPYSSNAWELSSDLIAGNLSDHISHLLSKIGGATKLSAVTKKWRMRIDCVLSLRNSDNSPHLFLSEVIIKQLGSYNAEVDFDYEF